MEKIVTKDWLRAKLQNPICKECGGSGVDFSRTDIEGRCYYCKGEGTVNAQNTQAVIVGRALLAIYRRQTDSEKASFSTKNKNGVGFSGPDAKLGSRCAEYFQKNGTLAPWMAKVWLVEKAEYPRICKYAKQLNEIANEKKARQTSVLAI